MPTSELIARVTGSLVWIGGVALAVFGYLTKDDEGFDSIGNALTIVLFLGPVFLLSIVTVVALVVRVRQPDGPRVGWLTWLLAGPPSLLGAYVIVQTVLRQLR